MSEQLENFTDEYQDNVENIDPNAPLMPFETSYKLTRDQEDTLIEHAMNRLTALEAELGREDSMRSELTDSPGESSHYDDKDRFTRSFYGKRRIYDLGYRNKVGWRARTLGGIYAESNVTLPVSRRITRQMIAKANSYFFATDPWFATYPVGENDKELADQAGKYSQLKMDDANLKNLYESAVERAFIVGECVVKTNHIENSELYRTNLNVLVDNQGMDILAADGDYITDEDRWVPLVEVDPETGEPVQSDKFVLKRDNTTPKPLRLIFVFKSVVRKKTFYKGPKAEVVHYRDFLCPLAAESIQDADCVAHLYDMPVMEIANSWRKQDVEGGADQQLKTTAEAVELLRNMAGNTGEWKTAKNSDRPEINDAGEYVGGELLADEPVSEVVEFYLRYDADGDGITENIILVVDRQSRLPIYYDYVANVTDDGLRPFTVIRVNPQEGRWYGEGAMESFESSQEVIDKNVNRWIFSQTGSGSVVFWNPEATIEGKTNPNLRMNMGSTYTLLPGKTSDDALQSVDLTDIKYEEQRGIFELFMQHASNESGVSNANDGMMSGLDSAKLATGVRNIEKSGNELFSVYLSHLEVGISETLRKMMATLFGNIDDQNVASYMDDETDEIIEIAGKDIRDISLDVRVLMTRHKGEQTLESAGRASEMIEKFYSLDPMVQANVAPFYREALRALQVKGAEEAIQPVQYQAQGGGGPINTEPLPKPPMEPEPNL